MTITSPINYQPTGALVALHDLQQLRLLAIPHLKFSKKSSSAIASGQHRSRAVSRGMEFEEVRLYQAGDDVRNIDWRVTARTQQTHTKCYRDEKEKPVITFVDQRRSTFFGSHYCFKSVYACYLSALINWSTLARGDRAGGLVLGSFSMQEIRPARSNKTVNRWLQTLTNANHKIDINSAHAEPSLSQGLKQLQHITHSGTECIVISDCYDLDLDCEKILHQLSRAHSIALYWLVDPLEKTLPSLENITLSDGYQKKTVSIDKKSQKKQYQQFTDKQKIIESLCRRLSIQLVIVDISLPLSDFIDVTKRRA
ncbi:MAG: hypothetical protein ACJA1S_001642 [Cellvibrionaceae bacterium]|jgi:uncharacterized protein (DUF58 family)